MENSSLSDARNFEILKAPGDYILFLYSDDYYDIDTINKLNTIIKK